MDQELIAYLDERFRETSQQIAELREETIQQISGLREETIQQISGLREETTRQISGLREETTRQISGLREETTRQISGLREETTRQFEQVDRRFEQVDRRFEQVDRRFEQIDDRFERVEATARQTLVVIEGLRHEVHIIAEGFIGLHEKLERYHTESTASFDQVRGWIEPYYRMLDGRLSVMEGRADRQQGDVMEAVQRILARPLQPPASSD